MRLQFIGDHAEWFPSILFLELASRSAAVHAETGNRSFWYRCVGSVVASNPAKAALTRLLVIGGLEVWFLSIPFRG